MIRAILWSIKLGFATAPRALALFVAIQCVRALLPTAQVLAVGQLLAVVGTGAGSQEWALALIATSLAIALMFPAGQMDSLIGGIADLRVETALVARVTDAAASADPRRMAKAEHIEQASAALLVSPTLGRLPTQSLRLGGACLTGVALMTALVPMNAAVAALVGLSLIPSLAAYVWVGRSEAKRIPESARHLRRATYASEQLLQQRPATELALLGTGNQVAQRVATERHHANLSRLVHLRSSVLAECVGIVISVVLVGAALLIAGQVAANTGASAGAYMGAIVAGVISGIGGTRFAGYAGGQLLNGSSKIAIFDRFANTAVGTPDHSQRKQASREVDELRLDGATVTYPGATRPALHDVSLQARKGEVVALVGENGAGKTTAIHALLGLAELDSGHVLFDGADGAGLELADRLGLFSVLPQDFARFEFSVRETLNLARNEPIADAELWSALNAAEAATLVTELPDGLDTQLGEQWGGVGLSGGEWQRLALARVLLRDAPVVVLDEPTSALDAKAEQEIFRLLQERKPERITIVVSHRAVTLREMDRIYLLDDGKVVEAGSFDELANSEGRFARLFAKQIASISRASDPHQL